MSVLALVPVAGLVVCVVLHVLAARLAPAKLADLTIGVAGGGLVVVQLAWRTGQEASLAVWFTTYLLLAYCYVVGFFNLSESARRIRLLIELHEAPGHAMTLDEILTAYNARMVVEARLRRLVGAGFLVERGGRYWIGHRAGLWIARGLAALAPLLAPQRRR